MSTPATPPKRRAPLSYRQLRWFAVALILGVTALFGGLREADHVTPLTLKETYDDGPLRITPLSVVTLRQADFLEPAAPPCAYLVLRAKVENVSDRVVPLPMPHAVIGFSDSDCPADAETTQGDIVSVSGVPAQYFTAFRVGDELRFDGFDPGFTDTFDLVWSVPRAALTDKPLVKFRFPEMTDRPWRLKLAEGFFSDSERYAQMSVTLSEPQ